MKNKYFILHEPGKKRIYFKIKKSNYTVDNLDKKIVHLIETTSEVLQEQYKAQTHLLSLINACVSHELRNPLNSIIAQIFICENLNSQMTSSLAKLEAEILGSKDPEKLKKELSNLKKQLTMFSKGTDILQASSDMMLSIVQDLLDFAQIKAGKFRKALEWFDVRQAIEGVNCIQQLQAKAKGITLKTRFINLSDLPANKIKEYLRKKKDIPLKVEDNYN